MMVGTLTWYYYKIENNKGLPPLSGYGGGKK